MPSSYTETQTRTESATGREWKIILRVGLFNFYDWIEGQGRFEADRCPVSDCLLTSDTTRYQRTADAVIISEMNPDIVKRYLPKSSHQVYW